MLYLFIIFFLGDKLMSNNVLSCHMHVTFHSSLTVQSYGKTVKHIDQLDNYSWHVLGFDTYRFNRVLIDWSIENVNPVVILCTMKKIYNKHLILIRLPLQQWKSGLTKEVAFLGGDNSVIFYFLIASEIWPCKKVTTVIWFFPSN
jgi:hypothetical protein